MERRSGAGAGGGGTAGATRGVAGGGFGEGEVELVGEGCQPGQHVSELVELVVARAFAYGAGQFAELLGQPSDGGRHPAGAVTLAVRLAHEALEVGEVH